MDVMETPLCLSCENPLSSETGDGHWVSREDSVRLLVDPGEYHETCCPVCMEEERQMEEDL